MSAGGVAERDPTRNRGKVVMIDPLLRRGGSRAHTVWTLFRHLSDATDVMEVGYKIIEKYRSSVRISNSVVRAMYTQVSALTQEPKAGSETALRSKNRLPLCPPTPLPVQSNKLA